MRALADARYDQGVMAASLDSSARSHPYRDDDVHAGPLAADRAFGLMLRPARSGVDLAGWCGEHVAAIDALLHQHGALLFRDFDVPSAADFERAAAGAFGGLFGEYGDLPRSAAGARIYHSTPYPPELMILWHNESAHLASWPMRIAFYCTVAARAGGCTPIVDSRALMRDLDAAVVEAFRTRGLCYVRNFIAGVEPTWERFFRTDDRAAVETLCRAEENELSWRDDGGLRVRRRGPGTARHPVTGAEVFFNQVQLHHVACLDPETRADLCALVDDEADLPRTVAYGDGTPIPDDVVRHIVDVCERTCVRVPWHPGDMIVLDNMLTAHGRDPYEGERRILVAMGRLTQATARS
jgi:alpha-ketoglutarate-dependent taurine dioxygenase